MASSRKGCLILPDVLPIPQYNPPTVTDANLSTTAQLPSMAVWRHGIRHAGTAACPASDGVSCGYRTRLAADDNERADGASTPPFAPLPHGEDTPPCRLNVGSVSWT